jgi:Asp-tRNA(Asn)/Glu-tRNA(Gln) amidotransferase A subunit family amidase
MSRTPQTPLNLSIRHLRAAYREGLLTPATLVEQIRTRIAEHAADNIWIHVLSDAELAPYLARLSETDPETLPLYGIPFAIKDNIDLAGVPTTAALPELAWTPERSATVVERLIAAGALPIGKTNLDQLATGLVGTRSPYGAVPNAFDPAISPEAAARAPPRRSRTASSASPWGRIPPARDVSRRRSTTWSASSRPAVSSAPAACCRPAARSTVSVSSRWTWPTPMC